jgi:hypothetical protein
MVWGMEGFLEAGVTAMKKRDMMKPVEGVRILEDKELSGIVGGMKVQASVKKLSRNCKIVRPDK